MTDLDKSAQEVYMSLLDFPFYSDKLNSFLIRLRSQGSTGVNIIRHLRRLGCLMRISYFCEDGLIGGSGYRIVKLTTIPEGFYNEEQLHKVHNAKHRISTVPAY